MIRVSGLLALCLVSFSSLADCQAILQELAKPYEASLTRNAALSSCKVWPYAPDKTLAVLMLEPKVKADPDFTDYDVAVFVVDSQSGNVLASQYHPKAIMDDAIYTSSVTIDTARYQLSPEVRAFGVRFNHRGSSSVNPINIERLNLYTLEAGHLTLVINNLQMNEFGGEWDGQCAGDFTETRRVLALGASSHQGYRDLELQETVINRTSLKQGEECVDSQETLTKARSTLQFDGKRYPVAADKLLDHRF
ncbi:hypothetical protein FHU10_5036 [Serratia fonticola]|uniref:Lipoprotein n=1 Tax=Serratia fonticola TaxID=47917 RepID=A0A542D485_SERFO|nr:hypothetical protein [Serratia fonticola]TQI80108.1 hypothetical protein FHU09_2667 [Serratia fonticola]TQI97865.1 hypothetical protein FHU11_3376 [Serratia fonticola]TVZ72363.1 hypothetical protein FHU10_5036 [Serratia fonticola]